MDAIYRPLGATTLISASNVVPEQDEDVRQDSVHQKTGGDPGKRAWQRRIGDYQIRRRILHF